MVFGRAHGCIGIERTKKIQKRILQRRAEIERYGRLSDRDSQLEISDFEHGYLNTD
jgi:hypothetical protein